MDDLEIKLLISLMTIKYHYISYLFQIFRLCDHKAHFIKEHCIYTGKRVRNQNNQMASGP